MLLTILCTISGLTWQAVIGVHISVSRGVASRDRNAEVVFPCNYTLDNRNHSANIKWICGGETVLVKDSLGQVRPGRNYRGRADMKMGCSLVLRNPRPSDTNLYTVRVIVPRDKRSEERQDILLVVSDNLRMPKSSTRRSLEMTTSNDGINTTEAPVTSRWRTCNSHDVVYCLVCVIIYGAVWLIIHCFSLCKNVRSGRVSVAVMCSRKNSIWWKLTLASTLVLHLMGTMICMIGVIRRDWTLSLVGIPVTLIGTFVYVLYSTLDARRSTGKQATAKQREMAKEGSINNTYSNLMIKGRPL